MSLRSNSCSFLRNAAFFVFVYSTLFKSMHTRIIIVDNSVRAGYNASTCSQFLLCPNLQSAFGNAKSSDRIEVKNGTYTGSNNKNICYKGCNNISDLTLIGVSSNCDDVEILQTSNSTTDRAIYARNSTFREISCMKVSNFMYSTGDTQIELELTGENTGKYDFHFSGGSALLVINTSNLIISNVSFSQNQAIAGGAVSIFQSVASFRNCSFWGNNAGAVGGAILALVSHVSMVSCKFTKNSAISSSPQSGIGGAIYFDSGAEQIFKLFQNLEIYSSVFVHNSAERGGGALYVASTSSRNNTFIVKTSEFRNNSVIGQDSCLSLISCSPRGGAIYANVLSVKIRQCQFLLNRANSLSQEYVAQGGAVYSGNLFVDVSKNLGTYFEDCEFLTNSAMGEGGALYLIDQPLILKSSKFLSNTVHSSSEYFSDSAPLGGAVWYSSSVPLAGSVSNCNFTDNQAHSGWGGAIYGVNSNFPLTVSNSTFISNRAYSSYTNRARGGAIMVSQPFTLKLQNCKFYENLALPHPTYPLTYSGYGGALFGQSVSLYIENCDFEKNLALTGQFDAGSGGGAISVENCKPVSIQQTRFLNNGAVGLFTVSSFSQPGSGGALYSKFSAVNITDNCVFEKNWVSAGGAAPAVGGAIAFYFDRSGTSSHNGLLLSAVTFSSNYALKQLCVPNSKESGEGGAIYFEGIKTPEAILRNVKFLFNVAVGGLSSGSTVSSLGGALSITEGTDLYCSNCTFFGNAALYGIGDDAISYSQDSTVTNVVYFVDSLFHNLSTALTEELKYSTTMFAGDLCTLVKNITLALQTVDSRLGTVRRRTISKDNDPSPPVHLNSHLLAPNSTRISRSGGYRKLLDLGLQRSNISGMNVFISFYPAIVIANGYAVFFDSSFVGFYHIFFGDVASILSETKMAESRNSASVIYGKFQTNLALTIVEADVFLIAAFRKFTIGQLSLFNATLFISFNIIISGDSFLYNSSVVGAGSTLVNSLLTNYSLINSSIYFPYTPKNLTHAAVKNPTIRFVSTVLAGLSLQSILSSSSSSLVSKIPVSNKVFGSRNISFISSLTFDSCTFVITKELIVRSKQHSSSNDIVVASKAALATTFLVVLKNKAVVNITGGAVISLSADTCFYATNTTTSGITNSGSIDLLGVTYSLALASTDDLSSSTKKNSQQVNVNSLTSKLIVLGSFQQTNTGSIIIYLNKTLQTAPVVALTTNKTLGGSIIIQFYDSSYAQLNFYNSLPSKWSLINFLKLEPPPKQRPSGTTYPVAIIAPPGLSVSNSFQAVKSSASTLFKSNGSFVSYTSSVQLTSIGCSQVNTYYDGYSTASLPYQCYICLSNSSCNLCGDGTCSLAGTCSSSSGTAFTQNTYCCSGGCGANGVCTASNSYTEFTCVCSFFYTGNNCQMLSTASIILIVVGCFIVLALVVSKLVFDKYRKQEAQVLDDIRNNILNVNTTTSHSKLSKNFDYIQHMQQALILNDVFVKYEEIKLEHQIGEGSFGVVYKATFRGAQVAVKKMKSMFVELSEKEMDEFKREAYVMSRLRHPNIVLVMGISLVDVEVLPLVKKYHQSVDESMRTTLDATPSSKPKPKGQKTVCIITEYLGQGSLADILYGENCLPPEVWTYELILTCALQAARGMLYLHTHQPPICHRDLKSSNLVVDENWVVKVTDFGMSRIVPDKEANSPSEGGPEISKAAMEISAYDEAASARESFSSQHSFSEPSSSRNMPGSRLISESRPSSSTPSNAFLNPEMTSNLGTTAWCAPELFTAENTTRYSVKVDVYSFAMVMWELWEKKRPFDEFHSRFDIMDAVKAGRRPHIGESCPPTYRAMIQRCWRTSPAQRPKFTTIVRYLKDELSHVKRNKGAATGIAAKSFLRSLSLSPADVESSDPRLRTQSSHVTAESKQRDSSMYGSTVAMIFDNGRHSLTWGASRLNDAWSSSRRPSVSSRRPSNSSAAGAESSSSAASASEQPAAAKDRTTLVAALNRSLSALTESPSVNATEEDYHMKFGGRKRYTDPALEKRLLSPGGPGERSLSPPTQPGKNSWRENYVMKFSGWRADNPDHGLPPSLTTPQPHSSSSVFAPSRAVISPLAPRLSGLDDAEDRRGGVSGGESSDLEHGNHQRSKDPSTGKPHHGPF